MTEFVPQVTFFFVDNGRKGTYDAEFSVVDEKAQTDDAIYQRTKKCSAKGPGRS